MDRFPAEPTYAADCEITGLSSNPSEDGGGVNIGLPVARKRDRSPAFYSRYKVDPAAWVALMDRRGHSPILVMHGFGPQRKDGPIMWSEYIDVRYDRPFNYSLDCGFWSMKCGAHADAIADYLFSVGRFHAFGCDPAHRPSLQERHSFWRYHGGKEPDKNEEMVAACNAPTTRWYKIPAGADEMAPAIAEGDHIAVDVRVTHFIPGQIFLMELNGQVVIRRIGSSPDGPTLLADNPKFPPVNLSSDEVTSHRMIGRIASIGRDAPGIKRAA